MQREVSVIMFTSNINYVQINMNRSKGASVNLLSFIVGKNIMIGLVQDYVLLFTNL